MIEGLPISQGEIGTNLEENKEDARIINAEQKLKEVMSENFNCYYVRFMNIEEYELLMSGSDKETEVEAASKKHFPKPLESYLVNDYQFHKYLEECKDNWGMVAEYQTQDSVRTFSLYNSFFLFDLLDRAHNMAKAELRTENNYSDLRPKALEIFRNSVLSEVSSPDLTLSRGEDKGYVKDAPLRIDRSGNYFSTFQKQFKRIFDIASGEIDKKYMDAYGEQALNDIHNFINDPKWIAIKGNLRRIIRDLIYLPDIGQYQLAVIYPMKKQVRDNMGNVKKSTQNLYSSTNIDASDGLIKDRMKNEKWPGNRWKNMNTAVENEYGRSRTAVADYNNPIAAIAILREKSIFDKIMDVQQRCDESHTHPIFDNYGKLRYPKINIES